MQKKYLNTRKNQFLKVRNSLLELEKNFYRIERQSIKNLKIEELFFKPIIVPVDHMDKVG